MSTTEYNTMDALKRRLSKRVHHQLHLLYIIQWIKTTKQIEREERSEIREAVWFSQEEAMTAGFSHHLLSTAICNRCNAFAFKHSWIGEEYVKNVKDYILKWAPQRCLASLIPSNVLKLT